MVIQVTRHSGAAQIDMRRGLGEWVRPDGCVNTRYPAYCTAPFVHPEPEGAVVA